jgi:hypothetical protein
MDNRHRAAADVEALRKVSFGVEMTFVMALAWTSALAFAVGGTFVGAIENIVLGVAGNAEEHYLHPYTLIQELDQLDQVQALPMDRLSHLTDMEYD